MSMRLMHYALAASILAGPTAYAGTALENQAPLKEEFTGSWHEAVRYISDDAKKSLRENAYAYVPDKQKLFVIGRNGNARSVETDDAKFRQLYEDYKTLIIKIHSHINLPDKQALREVQNILGIMQSIIIQEAKPYCNNPHNTLEEALACSVPEFGRDTKGIPTRPRMSRQVFLAERCTYEQMTIEGTVPSMALPSADDFYNAIRTQRMLGILNNNGSLKFAIVLAGGEETSVTWYSAGEVGSILKYAESKLNELANCKDFKEGKIDAFIKSAAEQGFNIRIEKMAF